MNVDSIHRQIEKLNKVQAFLSSIRRNSIRTSAGYKTSLAYFQEFLSKHYNNNFTLETILDAILKRKATGGNDNVVNVYTLLEQFIAFMHEEKKVNAVSINQYLNGVRSFLAYYDIYIIPAKFKRKVKLPKVYREEEQPIDVKDIRTILLNCHNRRLRSYLLVLASSGARAVEACAIRLKDVDFSTRPTKVHIRKEYSKTRVSRDICISDEATKYLKDWISFKYNNDMANNRPEVADLNFVVDEYKKKQPNSLVFQVQRNNLNVTPQSIYFKLAYQFQELLKVAGFDERKEGMKRHKVTLHSFRRFVKTTISDCAGKEYSEWFLGHAKSSYYVNKPEVRLATYAEKCMKYLIFLDYSTLEVAEKRVEAQLAQKDKEIDIMREQLFLLEQTHKKRENDFDQLKATVEFLTNKVNASIIAEPSSEILSNEKGIPNKIKLSANMGTAATSEIANS